MRYQQQQARMSPNWREKEAMSTQKLMAATTHLHLKQDEEITRLRRNVSSLAKKNHGLMRQVHELVSRLRQYPPPRIPEDTRPTNQDEETQEDPSPEPEEDTQMVDTVDTEKKEASSHTKEKETVPQPSMEYDILPDWIKAPASTPTPTPTPTPAPSRPPSPPAQPTPLSPPTPPTPPKAPEAPIKPTEEEQTENPRLAQIPPAETTSPAETHPDREVKLTILGMKSPEAKRQRTAWNRYNKKKRPEDQLTWRSWVWFSKTKEEYTLCGNEEEETNYSIKAKVRANTEGIDCYKIELEDVDPEDREAIEFYHRKFVVGFPGEGGKREKVDFVTPAGWRGEYFT